MGFYIDKNLKAVTKYVVKSFYRILVENATNSLQLPLLLFSVEKYPCNNKKNVFSNNANLTAWTEFPRAEIVIISVGHIHKCFDDDAKKTFSISIFIDMASLDSLTKTLRFLASFFSLYDL